MNSSDKARLNLELAGFFDEDSDYGGMLGEAVMRLIKTHRKEGHSGGSSSIAIELFRRVANDVPLTGEYWDIKHKEMVEFSNLHGEHKGDTEWTLEISEKVFGPRPSSKGDTCP